MENVLELDNTQYQETAVSPARDPAVIAAEINAIKLHTCGIVTQSIFEIGKRLCEAKESVDHGEWATWLKENVAYSEITAQRLMRSFREMSGEAQELEEGEANVFEGLNFSQMVALFPLPKERREEFVKQNEIADKSAREIQELVEREKRALEEAQKAREDAEKARKEAEDAAKAKAVAEGDLRGAKVDQANMRVQIKELKDQNKLLRKDTDQLRADLNEKSTPKEVPPSQETLDQIKKEVAAEFEIKADPDVQGINFNLGDLSERVQKIDEQLARIKERNPEMAASLQEKVKQAMWEILHGVEWKPWKDEDVPF